MTEDYSKQILKRSVAQICQVIGWNSIHSSPLQILTDLMQHYINGIARLSNKYTLLYGQTEPNLDHLALAFNEIGISISELQEYVKFIDSSSVADVPVYPLPRESHLNMLKPGCWENVTRPVHIHEHLPPMHPESESNSTNGSSGTFVSPNVSGSIDDSPEGSPKPAVFKRPGDPVSDIVAKRIRPMMDDEIRPLREISSVMMTTSGFLSPAREGKLPEARTIPIPMELESENEKKPEIQSLAIPPKDQPQPEVKPEKKKKSKSEAKKTDKENKTKDDSFSPSKDDEPKVKKLATSGKESSKLKALKTGAVKVLAGSSKSEKKKNKLLAPNIQTMKINKSKSPKAEKRPFPLNYDSEIFEEKLTSEPDKQKLNIFKKISKVKEEHDDKLDLESIHDAKRISMDATIEAVIQKSRTSSESLRDHDNNDDNYQSLYPFGGSESPLPSMTSGIPKTPDIPKISEPKKKKKDKHRDKEKNDKEKYTSSPKSSKYYDDISKPKTPDVDMNADDSLPSSFPFYNYPPGPGLLPFSHPLIPNNPLVGGLYPKIPPTPPFVNALSKQDLPSLPPSLTITPINPYPSPSMSSSTPASITITPSRLMSSPSMTNTPTSSASSDAIKSALDSSIASNSSSKIFSSASASPSPNKMKKEKNRLVDSEKEKKQKNKIKKKKNKKEKIKSKDKSERKKLKLEKKEKNKEKSKLKKEKKEKKKDKKDKKEKKKDKQHKDEKSDIVGLVPKITVKLNHPGSSQTPPPESTHRKIVIKPVVKKDEPDIFTEPERSLLRLKTTKLSKHSGSYAEDDLKMVTSSQINPLPPVYMDVKPENEANKVWICPACCGPDDGSPMIACDSCDMWYHWTCVGIQVAPESDWYCQKCLIKHEELMEKKKKHKKKKF